MTVLRALGFGLLVVGAAVLTAIPAIGGEDPRVVFATAGATGNGGGAISRYTLRFSEAMVPLGAGQASPPAKVTCSIAATGRWSDAQTWIAEFAKPLPGGLSCTIKLVSDLRSMRGALVSGTSSFLIDTGGPSVRAVIAGDGDEVEEDQVFLVATNTPATPLSITANGYCAVDGIGEKIPLDVLDRATAPRVMAALGEEYWPLRDFLDTAGIPQTIPSNADERAKAFSTVSAVKCHRPLPPGRDVSLVWGAGITDQQGKSAGRDQRYDYTVRKLFAARFECARVNPQAGCSPVQKAYVRFTAPVPVSFANQIALGFADGSRRVAEISEDEKGSATVSTVRFKPPFPAGVGATLELPKGLKDESGRLLSNSERFPLAVRIDPSPPLIKFAANFGILEAQEGGVLPVTVRAVESDLGSRVNSVSGDSLRIDAGDGEVAKWLQLIAKANANDVRTEGTGKAEREVNYTGTTSLLKNNGKDLKIDLPGGGKAFEVVGIPLRQPGFYVVELASPALGQALLGRKATRYVSAGALVTNMAVHFKWGRGRSLAWVTTLDGAVPVGGADVRVTDSCSGKQIARGVSDKQGRLVVTGLPEPDTYGNCDADNDSNHPLMISARYAGDFSFTMTEWSDGIRPYDFDLPYGSDDRYEILHTVFDRTLVKQGDTVNMKHIFRKPIIDGFAFGTGFSGKLRLTHRGSDTEFEVPVAFDASGTAETSWSAPQGAPQGDYDLSFVGKERTFYTNQSIRVDEYRLPTMRATIQGPKMAVVRPTKVPLNLFVGYLSGGPAAGLPVSVRTAFSKDYFSPEGWDGWNFGGRPVTEGTIPLNGDGNEPEPPMPLAQTVPITLGSDGTANTEVELGQGVETETSMTVEMDYQDANGETLTASRRLSLFPSALQLGVKTDGWMMRDNDLRLKLVALGTEGQALKGKPIKVELFSRETLTARRRLIGGFYAYDNQLRTTRLGTACTTVTDSNGLASCAMAPGVSGEVLVVATSSDANGNPSRAVTSVWLTGEDEWWFGGDNGDRMDLIPERKSYQAGETAKFQVRMPFRTATALVTVEREGVMSSFVTELSGKDPVISVKMPGNYAPDVYVSVLAVRGRIGGFKLWTAQIAREWNLPFLNRDGYSPTALVDLAKPSYRLGIARVRVGWDGFKLGVKVKADRQRYSIRETANVDIQVKRPDGKASTAEIAFAAVDEALLQLSPNDSWDVLSAMMGDRPLAVLTSTAQTQIVGKRHYGRKAVEAGGGGGDATAVARSDFKPVLLWRGRVAIDREGHARIPVELSDSLSSFRLVAIANEGASLFGMGEARIRTAQDLTIYSGLPPLVRSGDRYGASFTLRNGTDKPMSVTAKVKVNPAVANGEPLTVTVPAGGSVPVTWHLDAPANPMTLNWSVEVSGANGKLLDQIAVTQAVIPAIPVEVWAGTLARVGASTSIPIQPPAGAIVGTGIVDVKLNDTLAPPLEGVRSYMSAYPYTCFEQQSAKAVVMSDGAAWDKLAANIPAYLDGDGLLRYFPVADMEGSPTLTAHILSLTSEAGYVIPEAVKVKMIDAMKAVVDGRLKRDTPWGENAALTRLSALAALSRHGASTAAMLSQIGLSPDDMPTSNLADWLTAIERTPGTAPTLRVAAEAALRKRIAFEGSRLDVVDQGQAAWWMMSSGDEMAIKVLLATLGRPGWSGDDGKMMLGIALRQRRGHWDTTSANAWGTIAARKFASLYPAQAIMGVTTLSLGGQSLTQNWPMTGTIVPLRFGLPSGPSPLVLQQSVGSGPWAMVTLLAAVPLTQPVSQGYRISKQISPILQKVPGQWTRGDVMKVRISVDAGAERSWVVVNDPIPPGGTIVGNLGGQSQLLANAVQGGEGISPSYIERGNDGWRGYFQWVPAGKFVVEYAVRLNGIGSFSLPPTRVEAMYSPEIKGAVPNAPVRVEMR